MGETGLHAKEYCLSLSGNCSAFAARYVHAKTGKKGKKLLVCGWVWKRKVAETSPDNLPFPSLASPKLPNTVLQQVVPRQWMLGGR